MKQILLVRHGQASFGKRDYDALSERGHEQARVLGRALAEQGVVPDLVVRGGLRRHEETVAGMLTGLGESIPEQVDVGWDEFDFQHLIEVVRPRYRNRVVMMADLAKGGRPRPGGPVAACVTHLLGGAGTQWAQLNRACTNTGVTKVLHGRSGLTLSAFNAHDHLLGTDGMLTYR